MSKIATTKTKANIKESKQPRVVKLTTIIWSVSLLIALAVGFYSGVTVRNAYAESVSAEAKIMVKDLKDSK